MGNIQGTACTSLGLKEGQPSPKDFLSNELNNSEPDPTQSSKDSFFKENEKDQSPGGLQIQNPTYKNWQ